MINVLFIRQCRQTIRENRAENKPIHWKSRRKQADNGLCRGKFDCQGDGCFLRCRTMTGWWVRDLFNGDLWVALPTAGIYGLFSLWMLIHAVQNKEYVWAVAILFGLAIWYFFYMYRSGSAVMSGFELPGAAKRQRIKELESQIHHIGNAVHHFQLGDVYFRNGKLAKAEACYRASLERDPEDIDARAHLGQCLLRLKRAAEARPILEKVCAENPKHDYGYSLMALAESQTAMNEPDAALKTWLQVTANHSYPRAKVQLAEL